MSYNYDLARCADLQPSTNYATVNNSASSYLMFLQENWTTNGLVGSGQECYGAAVPGANMSCISPSYGYDNLNRLTSASEALTRNPSSGTGYSRNFNYDEFGNMSVSAYSSNVPVSGLMPVTSPNTFNATNNQLKSATYDPRGNMTLVAAGSESMKYDGESRQIQTLDSGTGGTGTANYLYDSAGQRVQKQVAGGATIVYVHDAFGQLVAEYNSAGITPVCTTCYLAYDQVGSVRLITDQKAGVVARHDYLPYGEEIPNGSAGRSSGNGFANNANLAQMFTGQERDGSTADLDYFNARHMSAYMGRFTQPDPANAGANIMNPQSWNAYAYVGGNPLGSTDPSGKCTVAVAGITQGSTSDAEGGFTAIAKGLGAVIAYPFSGTSLSTSVAEIIAGGASSNDAQVALSALQYALSTNTGSVDVLAYSGGASSYTKAYGSLSSADQQRIGTVLYISPGASGALAVNDTTSIVRGSGIADVLAMAGTEDRAGTPTGVTGCDHRDPACMSNSQTATKAFNSMEKNGACSSQKVFEKKPVSLVPAPPSVFRNSSGNAGFIFVPGEYSNEGTVINGNPGGFAFPSPGKPYYRPL